MANIAVTTYCNLKCPYCFADNMIQTEDHQNITIRQLQKILLFLAKSNNHAVGIIGGEPTLHPQFDRILQEIDQYTLEMNTMAILFTNGICLDQYMDSIGTNINILINVNNPDNMSTSLYNHMVSNLMYMKDKQWFTLEKRKACIGCNLYIDETEYQWIWDIADKISCPIIRVSVTAPGGKYLSWRNYKDEYYTTMKPIFMKFCKTARDHNIILGADCNQIPRCYFTNDEFELVTTVMHNYRSDMCHPVVDITPDFKATACFGSYDPIDCAQFKNLEELTRYLMFMKNFQKQQANCSGRCANCEQHKLLTCQGGCLGFSNIGG